MSESRGGHRAPSVDSPSAERLAAREEAYRVVYRMSVDDIFREETLEKLLGQFALEAAMRDRLAAIDELRPPALHPGQRDSSGRVLPFVREDDGDDIRF
jgi:hypothetical protein